MMSDPYKQLRVDHSAKIPLASQVSTQITWLLASGQIQPEDSLPSVRDLADRLGIHMHTARAAYRQLEESGLVVTRQGRGTIITGYDWTHLARSRPDVPSFTIGILIPSHSFFYIPFLNAIETAAHEEALMFMVCNTHDDSARVIRWLNQLVSKDVDGILIASRGLPENLSPEGGWEEIRRLPPMVFVDIPDSPPPRILFDHFGGGLLAGEHMLAHDYTNMAVVIPPLEWSNVAEIHNGYLAAYADAGKTTADLRVVQVSDFSLASGRAAAEQLLASSELPQAIFAAGDYLALGVLQTLHAHGIQIPEDVALIGYSGTELISLVHPALTTVQLDPAHIGEVALQTLRMRMAGQETESVTRQSVSLVVRRSCGCET